MNKKDYRIRSGSPCKVRWNFASVEDTATTCSTAWHQMERSKNRDHRFNTDIFDIKSQELIRSRSLIVGWQRLGVRREHTVINSPNPILGHTHHLVHVQLLKILISVAIIILQNSIKSNFWVLVFHFREIVFQLYWLKWMSMVVARVLGDFSESHYYLPLQYALWLLPWPAVDQ